MLFNQNRYRTIQTEKQRTLHIDQRTDGMSIYSNMLIFRSRSLICRIAWTEMHFVRWQDASVLVVESAGWQNSIFDVFDTFWTLHWDSWTNGSYRSINSLQFGSAKNIQRFEKRQCCLIWIYNDWHSCRNVY